MAVNLEYIQFKSLLFDASNKTIADFHVIIQFYNINLNSWASLTKTLVVKKSKLNYKLEIPDRISTGNQTIRIVREVLKSGGIPTFRIINENKEDELTEVITVDYKVSINTKNKVLLVDFGKNWLLKDDLIVEKEKQRVIASSLPVFEFNNSIGEIEKEREALIDQQKESNKEITRLNDVIATLAQEKEDTNSELLEVKKEINKKEKLTVKLNSSIKKLKAKLITKEDKNNELEVIRSSLQEQITEIGNEKENLTKEKEAFLVSVKMLQDDTQKLKETIEVKSSELLAKENLTGSLERKITKLQKEVEEVKEFTTAEHPNKLSASKVYGSIVNDVIKADEGLINSKYKLANISLNLKTTVEKGPEGTVLGLLDFETAKDINGAAISDISIDIVPNATAAISKGQKMPDILGLTETAVRKVLLDYGLKLDAVYHPTNDANLIEGQSFKQSPAPEADIIEGQEVIVIFAKPIN